MSQFRDGHESHDLQKTVNWLASDKFLVALPADLIYVIFKLMNV